MAKKIRVEPISGWKCPNGHMSVVKETIEEVDDIFTEKYVILKCLKCEWNPKIKKSKFENYIKDDLKLRNKVFDFGKDFKF